MALTDKKRESNNKYLAKFKTVSVRLPVDDAVNIQAAAAEAGQSLQGYILQAVRERMERDKAE